MQYLDYDKFAKYSEITSEEANEYFKFLKNNKFIIEKQVTLCPNCKEECVIDTSLYDSKFECEECGYIFEYRVLKRHSVILYKINSEVMSKNKMKVKSQFSNENNVIEIKKIKGRKEKELLVGNEKEIKVKVFLSYCHEDELMKKDLDKALVMLKRNNKIETWDDRCIIAGNELEKEILENLKTANIILLLVSQDFLASAYCFEKEMKIALERHNNGEAVVIPVILRTCDWLNSELSRLVAVPNDGKPIKTWVDKDEAYYAAKQEIEKSIDAYIDKFK